MHYSSFFAYMALMGTTGILDHSGIRASFPGVYDATDHDAHHEKYDVNYGFPFVWLDLLHGTYEGTFWGRVYSGRGPASEPKAQAQPLKDEKDIAQADGAESKPVSRKRSNSTSSPAPSRRRAKA
jgi:sterol desaturase/sphingolipid hydroxylase (fatty acid hydroxylase superfamily)